MASMRLSIPSHKRPPTSSNAFHLTQSLSDSSDDEQDSALPFPTALARKDFLAPDFHAATFLSSLFPSDADTTSAHRHQTLEDLRSELRERSSAISTELLELVNSNYTSFLGLGDELKGGEDRVEDVRVALLGFKRAVEDIRGRVADRRNEVHTVIAELSDVKSQIELGRTMLEIDERVSMLESRLAVASTPNGGSVSLDDSEPEEEEDGMEADFVGSSPAKLALLARDYVLAEQLALSIGRDTPFITKIEERITRCRNTILLDLNNATKEARRAGQAGQARTLRLLAVYRVLDAEADAIRTLKEK